eukprot:s6431_g1.t1
MSTLLLLILLPFVYQVVEDTLDNWIRGCPASEMLRSRSTLLRCAAGVALCVALQAALSFVAPASGAAKA